MEADTNPRNPVPSAPKKKFPLWAKLVIAAAVLLAGVGIFVQVGLSLLGGYIGKKAGESLSEENVAKMIERGIEAAGRDAQVRIKDKAIIIADKESGKEMRISANVELPEAFPKDIPVFSPSRVVGSMTLGRHLMVSLETESDGKDAVDFYKGALEREGWNNTFSINPSSNTYTGRFAKGERALVVTVAPSGPGKHNIGLNLDLGAE